MNCHLITIKVSIKCSANQWVQLNRFTFYENSLKGLHTKPMEGRRTVEDNRTFGNYLIQNIPHFFCPFLNHFSSRLDGGHKTTVLKFVIDKGFKEFQCHFLWNTTLMKTKMWTNNNNGTSGIIHTFTEQVLTKTSLFTFQHIRKGFQRTLIGTGDNPAATAVIKKNVHCFLQHTFFVTNNDIRCIKLKQSFQTIIPVDHPTVKIIEI